MKYATCPDCGAHLDFGEVCDCRNEACKDNYKTDAEIDDQENQRDSKAIDALAS